MLKQLTEKIISDIETLSLHSDIYKGEFAEGGEWNPKLPCGLVDLTGFMPSVISSGGEMINKGSDIFIYIADKDTESMKVLDTIESVIDLFNGVRLKVVITPAVPPEGEDPGTSEVAVWVMAFIGEQGCRLHGYFKGVKVYILHISVASE